MVRYLPDVAKLVVTSSYCLLAQTCSSEFGFCLAVRLDGLTAELAVKTSVQLVQEQDILAMELHG